MITPFSTDSERLEGELSSWRRDHARWLDDTSRWKRLHAEAIARIDALRQRIIDHAAQCVLHEAKLLENENPGMGRFSSSTTPGGALHGAPEFHAAILEEHRRLTRDHAHGRNIYEEMQRVGTAFTGETESEQQQSEVLPSLEREETE